MDPVDRGEWGDRQHRQHRPQRNYKREETKFKGNKQPTTRSLTCNPFNRGCIFDRQAMALATKASFVDQDLTRYKRKQTQY